MTRIELYRDCAAECLKLAGKTQALADRAILLGMAAKWHELADALERLTDIDEAARPYAPIPARRVNARLN